MSLLRSDSGTPLESDFGLLDRDLGKAEVERRPSEESAKGQTFANRYAHVVRIRSNLGLVGGVLQMLRNCVRRPESLDLTVRHLRLLSDPLSYPIDCSWPITTGWVETM
jgi:hypothetical protein